jgi:bacteriorhodopsin
MKLPIVGIEVDERFLTHRLRSTSLAGIVGGVLAILLFLWHLLVDHTYNWELFAVGATFAVVKLAAMLWYRLTD